MEKIISRNPQSRTGIDFIHVYRVYKIIATSFAQNSQENPTFNLLIKINTEWIIDNSISELIQKGIPQLGTLIEIKYPREERDFQKFVEEIGKDALQLFSQTKFNKIIAFIYDQGCFSEQHIWAKQALEKIPRIDKAIIVCSPSTLRKN